MGKRATPKKATVRGGVLARLTAEEARGVLESLLRNHPELKQEAVEIAKSSLADVSYEDVAAEVEDLLKSLSHQDMAGRCGRQLWGYVEPTEAAWELLEETIEPLVNDVKRLIETGLIRAAAETSKGLLLGLYLVRSDVASGDVLDCAPDFATETACAVLATWRRGKKRKKSVEASFTGFAREHLPEWVDMVSRALSSERQ